MRCRISLRLLINDDSVYRLEKSCIAHYPAVRPVTRHNLSKLHNKFRLSVPCKTDFFLDLDKTLLMKRANKAC